MFSCKYFQYFQCVTNLFHKISRRNEPKPFMIVEVPPYTIVFLIAILLLNLVYLFNNIYKQEDIKRHQAFVYALTVLTLSMYLLFSYFALIKSNQHKIWEFDSNTKLLKYKKAQFLIDSFIKMCILMTIRLVLIELNHLRSFGLIDNSIKCGVLLVYVIFRIFLVGYVLGEIDKDYAMFVVESTVFEMAESVGIIFMALYLLYTLRYLKNQMEDKLIIDHFAVVKMFNAYNKSMIFLLFGLVFEITYRAVFLHLATAEFTKTDFILKETFMFVRIISVGLLFLSINTILCVHETAEEEDLDKARTLLAESKFFEDTSENTKNSRNSADSSNMSEFEHLKDMHLKI